MTIEDTHGFIQKSLIPKFPKLNVIVQFVARSVLNQLQNGYKLHVSHALRTHLMKAGMDDLSFQRLMSKYQCVDGINGMRSYMVMLPRLAKRMHHTTYGSIALAGSSEGAQPITRQGFLSRTRDQQQLHSCHPTSSPRRPFHRQVYLLSSAGSAIERVNTEM